jgi:hypothetical protein
MARRPFQENRNPENVDIVLGANMKINDEWKRCGDVVSTTPSNAADLKSLRMARDLTPAEQDARGQYLRRDMQAGG